MRLEIKCRVDEESDVSYFTYRLSSLYDLQDVFRDNRIQFRHDSDGYYEADITIRYNSSDEYTNRITYSNNGWVRVFLEIKEMLCNLNNNKSLLMYLSDVEYNRSILFNDILKKRLKYFDEPMTIEFNQVSFDELLNFFRKRETKE